MTEENRALGTPLGKHPTRVLFLGSGELGKEVTIELMRLGAWVCAADSYAGAPAQQVAHEYRVLDMANADQLRALFDEIQPDIIVPEVEAIATSELAAAAARGAQVVPSAEIAAICMDRERLRVLAHEELGLPTTPYRFAGSLEELREGAQIVGYPCVVKPIMSSSGHGQSVVRSTEAIDAAWTEAQEGRRAHDEGDVSRVIVEALAPLDYELTVLTVSSSAGIVTCAPIGQRQESGDYRESWQPATFTPDVLEQAQHIARTAVEGLVAKAKASGEKGWGVFGVELFVLTDGNVLFNEVSPRPHDTGMVTMASQRLSEFALHARPADHTGTCRPVDSARHRRGKPCDRRPGRWRSGIPQRRRRARRTGYRPAYLREAGSAWAPTHGSRAGHRRQRGGCARQSRERGRIARHRNRLTAIAGC